MPERLANAEVEASTFDPYMPLTELSRYAGISVRTIRDHLRDPYHPLPHYRITKRKILVRQSEYDAWVRHYRRMG